MLSELLSFCAACPQAVTVHLSPGTINTRFFIIDGVWAAIRELETRFCGVSSTLPKAGGGEGVLHSVLSLSPSAPGWAGALVLDPSASWVWAPTAGSHSVVPEPSSRADPPLPAPAFTHRLVLVRV